MASSELGNNDIHAMQTFYAKGINQRNGMALIMALQTKANSTLRHTAARNMYDLKQRVIVHEQYNCSRYKHLPKNVYSFKYVCLKKS